MESPLDLFSTVDLSTTGVNPISNLNFPGPTWNGYIHDTSDALVVVEACLVGILQQCTRRPRPEERWMIRSGAVFVYEERTSGIKRWTDGLKWTPSRTCSEFLVYRELDTQFGPSSCGLSLYKKTTRVTHGAHSFRLVAYFDSALATTNGQALIRPSHDISLGQVKPRPDLRVMRGNQDLPGEVARETREQLFDTQTSVLPAISLPYQSSGLLGVQLGAQLGVEPCGQQNSLQVGCDIQRQCQWHSPVDNDGTVTQFAQQVGVPPEYVQQMIRAWRGSQSIGNYALNTNV